MFMADDDSSAKEASGIFLGLRFLLSGIHPDSYDQLSAAVEQNGGVNIDDFCTHVVVSKSVLWDDPICENARKKGNSLVTETWVSDCLERGAITDENHVVYKPLRNSEGIPGSNNIVVCSTGYRTQARENVMRMVSLMGATFCKRMDASLVTHLVCYEFAEEKDAMKAEIIKEAAAQASSKWPWQGLVKNLQMAQQEL